MKNNVLMKTIIWLLKFSRVILVLTMLIFVVDASSSLFNVTKSYSSFMPYCLFTSDTPAPQTQMLQVQSSTPLTISHLLVQFDGLPPRSVISWMILYRIISYMLGIYVLSVLIRVVKTVMKNQLFNRQNAIYLRHSAIAILAGFLLKVFFSIFETVIYQNKISLEGFHLTFVIEKYTTFGLSMGLIMLVFAEVFRVGTELKEENDLTV